jgi:hypothetical protein
VSSEKLVVVDAGGDLHLVDVHRCDAQDHEPRIATRRLFWVTGPVEYCDQCAAWMLKVAEVLGVSIHAEDLPLPAPPHRRPVRALRLQEPREKE